MKRIGKMTPLMILGVIVTVGAIVAAAVLLTSNTVSVDQSVRLRNQITLYPIETNDIFVGDVVTYDISAYIPQELTDFSIDIGITNDDYNIMQDDVTFKLFSTPIGWEITELSGYNYDPSEYMMNLHTEVGIESGEFSGALSLQFNTVGNYHISVTLSGYTVD